MNKDLTEEESEGVYEGDIGAQWVGRSTNQSEGPEKGGCLISSLVLQKSKYLAGNGEG